MSHNHRVEALSKIISSSIDGRFPDAKRILCLDIGCGDMKIAETIQKHCPKTIWSCIDIHDLPEHLKADARWSKYNKYDGKNVPFPDKSMDIILLCDVLHHDQRNAFNIMQESVRVGKVLIIKDHFEYSNYSRIMLKIMDFFGNWSYGITMPRKYFTIENFTELYHSAGLKAAGIDIGIDLYSHLFLPRWLLNPDWQFIAIFETR